MIRLEYVIPCQLTSVDQRTNAVSLFHIIESLDVIRRPGESEHEAWARAVVPMEVVTLWRQMDLQDSDTVFTQTLTFAAPDGSEEELSRVPFSVPHFRHRLNIQLPPVSVREDGDLGLRVYLASGDASQEGGFGELVFEYPIRVTMSSLPIVIELNPDELDYLKRPIAGQGGFQSLLRRLQGQLAQSVLVLSTADAERLIRYATQYGAGGFQARLGRVVEQARTQLQSL